ncbi:hypothetical protein FBZ93_105103 [Bradyrhizobium macuxiense]|uniref:Uncharacterized protein n=1 Tax=Bradyrhizobium macuxiense TaxID=1755647 RepID=A0A560LYM2_9BRAD|nr:hypothetical protein FBZ93_105103 [Bradyrhizobium macuxiense]
MANENWDAALGLWERLREKEKPVHLWLRYAAISGKVLSKTADEALLKQYDVLKDRLSSFDPDLLDQELGATSTERR